MTPAPCAWCLALCRDRNGVAPLQVLGQREREMGFGYLVTACTPTPGQPGQPQQLSNRSICQLFHSGHNVGLRLLGPGQNEGPQLPPWRHLPCRLRRHNLLP